MTPNEFDQVLAVARDTVPRLWYAYYTGAVRAGFSVEQALTLVQTFILSTNRHGIRPPTAEAPDKQQEE